ncbi:hypothetical protein DFP78_102419 [Photobacterium lutimaris]|nr:hypothetical protein DFP78_102419 [Photobacterium lutimaris]
MTFNYVSTPDNVQRNSKQTDICLRVRRLDVEVSLLFDVHVLCRVLMPAGIIALA